MKKIYLTTDYEIFGNGSGCIERCVTAPAAQMMKVAERHGARMTFFVDVLEFIAFEKALEQGFCSANIAAVAQVREQLQEAVSRGHDVQLHLHPQWLDAAWCPEKGWQLNMAYWRIGGLDQKIGYTRLAEMVQQATDWLNGLLKTADAGYACRSFRAGAWCIQPEEAVLRALRQAGIFLDTTVAPGSRTAGELTFFDFTEAPADQWRGWPVADTVTRPEAEGAMYELPIFTAILPFRLRALKKLSRHPVLAPQGCIGDFVGERQPQKKGSVQRAVNMALGVLQNKATQFDFCSLSRAETDFMLAKAAAVRSAGSGIVPIVTISHPKAFGNPEQLAYLLRAAETYDTITLDRTDEPSLWRSASLRELHQNTGYAAASH
ncbi:hypothetical protein CYPRO_2480 [Cyclonatronum proteinivorum]|uniref:Polysaccharide deacetylase n=1 Tax=Cyclonatronum proteinivorum TaxID=1457365 RepID=A0A345UMM0_9BACT|nr:hypothetical protein [Cyclonatronum proteinivorum]AXJ01722.1 hypothetical protein CYPRO_2480 [Cyclonatronum proteinivorum]